MSLLRALPEHRASAHQRGYRERDIKGGIERETLGYRERDTWQQCVLPCLTVSVCLCACLRPCTCGVCVRLAGGEHDRRGAAGPGQGRRYGRVKRLVPPHHRRPRECPSLLLCCVGCASVCARHHQACTCFCWYAGQDTRAGIGTAPAITAAATHHTRHQHACAAAALLDAPNGGTRARGQLRSWPHDASPPPGQTAAKHDGCHVASIALCTALAPVTCTPKHVPKHAKRVDALALQAGAPVVGTGLGAHSCPGPSELPPRLVPRLGVVASCCLCS